MAVSLCALTAVVLAAEVAGLPTQRAIRLSGDFRREAHAFEQYGQLAFTAVVIALIWQLDAAKRKMMPAIIATLLVSFCITTTMKHAIGRWRPGHGEAAAFGVAADAGRPSEGQSFPSGHSAAAVALTVVLASLYPRARLIFWALAITCAALRYINNAHWPSDVLAGITIGYCVATAMWSALVVHSNRESNRIIPVVPAQWVE